jgi:glycogen operon protein
VTARIWPGRPYPLGASYDGHGVNFALFSEHATAVELCLFDRATGARERETLPLPERTAHVFHGYLPGIGPGQLYGFRVHGPYEPRRGLRFNPAKLVLDPYAHAVANEVDWTAPMFPFDRDDPRGDLAIDVRDNAHGAPKGVVVDGFFFWEDDQPPRRPWRDTVIYELHVKGFTARHPEIPERLRGTYAGLGSEPAVRYLRELGVTAVELLPVHEIADEPEVIARGLHNYWGYSTLGYFAPAGRYAASGRMGEQVSEFKEMVKALHRAGIEVILDVVYNHSAEGDHKGPMLSLRGIDNRSYYHLDPRDPRRYVDFTGCGNSVNAGHPQALKLIMDSLRYWAVEMHVDGFRFDLASTLARELYAVDKLASFFDVIHQDPVISRTKLIAEPWDVGEGGYQVGNFPVLWTEWNGRYRDAVRRFWKGAQGVAAELGYRLTGSSDLYENSGRRPHASINFVTAHDGFTLHDLVSYAHKHNEANGEGNRDGTNDNDSDNHGAEGETDDLAINTLRARQMRNLLTTLVVSQGVPMLSGGDEIGRTQRGNNNAYCQDSELTWHEWALDDPQRALLAFTKRLLALRHAQPVLRRRAFFSGGYVRGSELKDIVWFNPQGAEMSGHDWSHPGSSALGMLLGGDAIPSLDRFGRHVSGDTLLVLVNGGLAPLDFVLPAVEWGERWEVLVDTRTADPPERSVPARAGERYPMIDRSVAVLRLARATPPFGGAAGREPTPEAPAEPPAQPPSDLTGSTSR